MKNVFASIHIKLFALSLALLVLGYVFLAQGPVDSPMSKTLAPLLLVGVYCVLIPVALSTKENMQKETDQKK